MFIINKYYNIYFKIVNRAKLETRSKKDSYFERHHIIPRSIGGTDHKENLVLLTAREHFICHRLLVKFTEGKERDSMISALHFISFSKKDKTRLRSRSFAIVKELYSERRSRASKGNHNNMFGRTHSDEVKQTHSKRMKGKYIGEKNPMYGKKRPEVSERNKLPKRWVTNGIIDKLILREEVENYIAQGFYVGRSNLDKVHMSSLMSSRRKGKAPWNKKITSS